MARTYLKSRGSCQIIDLSILTGYFQFVLETLFSALYLRAPGELAVVFTYNITLPG